MMHTNQGNNPSLNLIANAIERGALYEVFIGLEQKSSSQHASLPTDDEFVFKSWVEYVEHQPQSRDKLWDLFKKIILQVSKHPEVGWLSIYYLYSWLSYAKKHNDYPAETQLIINDIITNVSQFREKLVHDFRWTGYEPRQFSLWNDFVRMVDILRQNHSFNFPVLE
jgi:hypothetical protein